MYNDINCFVVESPGIAFFTSLEPDARDAIVNALSNGWPALIFVIMSALIAGMVFWFSVCGTSLSYFHENIRFRK